jgi:hypothetical protein
MTERSRVSEVYRGYTIYYTPPPERVWSFKPKPDAPLQSYRSAFQARRAINEMLDGSSEVWPRRDSVRQPAAPSSKPNPPRGADTRKVRSTPGHGEAFLHGPGSGAIGRLLGAETRRQISVTLPASGRTVAVPAYQRRETRFAGVLPENFRTVPNKVAVDFNGAALYPEFAIVRRLEAAGWGAAWRKNWQGAAFWSDIAVTFDPPPKVLALFDRIAAVAGAGAWDILAWKGDQVLFIESKQYGSDKLTLNQRRWLEVALDQGIPLNAFAVFEYRA